MAKPIITNIAPAAPTQTLGQVVQQRLSTQPSGLSDWRQAATELPLSGAPTAVRALLTAPQTIKRTGWQARQLFNDQQQRVMQQGRTVLDAGRKFLGGATGVLPVPPSMAPKTPGRAAPPLQTTSVGHLKSGAGLFTKLKDLLNTPLLPKPTSRETAAYSNPLSTLANQAVSTLTPVGDLQTAAKAVESVPKGVRALGVPLSGVSAAARTGSSVIRSLMGAGPSALAGSTMLSGSNAINNLRMLAGAGSSTKPTQTPAQPLPGVVAKPRAAMQRVLSNTRGVTQDAPASTPAPAPNPRPQPAGTAPAGPQQPSPIPPGPVAPQVPEAVGNAMSAPPRRPLSLLNQFGGDVWNRTKGLTSSLSAPQPATGAAGQGPPQPAGQSAPVTPPSPITQPAAVKQPVTPQPAAGQTTAVTRTPQQMSAELYGMYDNKQYREMGQAFLKVPQDQQPAVAQDLIGKMADTSVGTLAGALGLKQEVITGIRNGDPQATQVFTERLSEKFAGGAVSPAETVNGMKMAGWDGAKETMGEMWNWFQEQPGWAKVALGMGIPLMLIGAISGVAGHPVAGIISALLGGVSMLAGSPWGQEMIGGIVGKLFGGEGGEEKELALGQPAAPGTLTIEGSLPAINTLATGFAGKSLTEQDRMARQLVEQFGPHMSEKLRGMVNWADDVNKPGLRQLVSGATSVMGKPVSTDLLALAAAMDRYANKHGWPGERGRAVAKDSPLAAGLQAGGSQLLKTLTDAAALPARGAGGIAKTIFPKSIMGAE